MRKIGDLQPFGGWGKVAVEPCRHVDHNPPTHICLEPGIYEHVCPGCGRVSTVVMPQTFYMMVNN